MHCFNNVADGFARILLRTHGMIAELFMEPQGKSSNSASRRNAK